MAIPGVTNSAGFARERGARQGREFLSTQRAAGEQETARLRAMGVIGADNQINNKMLRNNPYEQKRVQNHMDLANGVNPMLLQDIRPPAEEPLPNPFAGGGGGGGGASADASRGGLGGSGFKASFGSGVGSTPGNIDFTTGVLTTNTPTGPKANTAGRRPHVPTAAEITQNNQLQGLLNSSSPFKKLV